jgi:hypothetical protein
MIKDLVVHLAQIPIKSVIMDIVVADVLLCRSWESKLGGSLQMDMAYATILVFGGVTKLAYTIIHPNHPNNYHVYSKDQDFGCLILYVNNEQRFCTLIANTPLCDNKEPRDGKWKMYFDGASSWEGVGACILLISPSGKKKSIFF